MKDKSKYYKEVIKSRMYKNAVAIWGVRDIDNFDPILKLMIESLASEINKLSNELDNMEARLLERLAGTLTPDLFLTVRPAHMILHAKPLEEASVVNKSTVFQHKKKDTSIVCFSPAGAFNVINGDVQALICASRFYQMDNRRSKELLARSIKRSEKFTDTLWLGLNIHPSINEIQNLSFYFDLPNIEKRNELLQLLSFSKWKTEKSHLSICPGIHLESTENDASSPLSAYDISNLSDASILNHYNHRYITVQSKIVNHIDDYRILPDELSDFFPDVTSAEKPIPLLWLKVSLPPGFDEYILDDFFVSVNAFPIINRKFYSHYTKTNPLVSVFRFETEKDEYFLSVEHVSDSNKRQYSTLPDHSNGKEKETGTYILKRGGAERFDARNARETMANLIDLLREENTSFAMFGKGFIDELVKRIDEEVVTIELKLNAIHQNSDISSYLVIDSDNVGETIYVDYWVTNCESANGIKSGTNLILFGGSQLETASLVTLTHSYGGKRRRDRTPDMYKYVLTSRDSVYTDEDIVNFCLAQFSERIISATVTKGIRVSPKPKEGLIRSIDVHITLKNDISQDSSKHQDLEDRLLSLLRLHSPEMYNYRVFISNSNQDNL